MAFRQYVQLSVWLTDAVSYICNNGQAAYTQTFHDMTMCFFHAFYPAAPSTACKYYAILFTSVTQIPILTVLLKSMKHQIKSRQSIFTRIVTFTSAHLYLFADSEQQMTWSSFHNYALQTDFFFTIIFQVNLGYPLLLRSPPTPVSEEDLRGRVTQSSQAGCPSCHPSNNALTPKKTHTTEPNQG